MPRVEDVYVNDARGSVSVALFESGGGSDASLVVLGGSSSWALQPSDFPREYVAWIGLSGTELSSLLPGVTLEAGDARFSVIPRPEGTRAGWACAMSLTKGVVRPGDGAAFPRTGRPQAGVLTLSDSCSRGEREDLSGPALTDALSEAGFTVVRSAVMPDGRKPVAQKLASWCDDESCDLVLTTGGTGFSPTDETPEATAEIAERLVPGLPELMRAKSAESVPTAWLSRATACIRSGTLVVNLPGSRKGALECLSIISPLLPHALEVLSGRPIRCGG
jgi:molybdenum cofactor synthesis domain-containing protein